MSKPGSTDLVRGFYPVARLRAPPPPGGDTCALGLSRDRPERELLTLSRAGVLSVEQVRVVQHGFLLEAMTEAVAELGYANTSANEVIRRARVSRQTFYGLFKSADACFVAALHAGHDHIEEAVRIGYGSAEGQPWDARVRASLVEVLSLLDAQPALAQLCVVQALGGLRSSLVAHQALITKASAELVRSADLLGPRRAVPDGVVCALVSGAWMRVHQRLLEPEERRAPLVSLTGELMYMICGAFHDLASATRQLGLPIRPPSRDWTSPPDLPPALARERVEQRGGGSRKQVLRYLAAHGGASNLMVAEHLGTTQSTASRRLAALAKDRLIVSQKRAGRHAWHVSERGRAMLAERL